jgi:hypothetical protein
MSLETLEEQHKRGGACDRERDNMWNAIHTTEEKLVEERLEQVRLSTRIAIYTGLICSIPALTLLVMELCKKIGGQ